MLTELGQSLDMETSEKPEVDFSYFTDERYKSIIKYKTSFYSFFLPVATSLYIVGPEYFLCYSASLTAWFYRVVLRIQQLYRSPRKS